MEKVMDTPRLSPTGDMWHKRGKIDPADVKMISNIVMEHNRMPGAFDYNFNQNFYSHNNDIDQESYLILGAKGSHYAHQSFQDGVNHSK